VKIICKSVSYNRAKHIRTETYGWINTCMHTYEHPNNWGELIANRTNTTQYHLACLSTGRHSFLSSPLLSYLLIYHLAFLILIFSTHIIATQSFHMEHFIPMSTSIDSYSDTFITPSQLHLYSVVSTIFKSYFSWSSPSHNMFTPYFYFILTSNPLICILYIIYRTHHIHIFTQISSTISLVHFTLLSPLYTRHTPFLLHLPQLSLKWVSPYTVHQTLHT
jgi:hypothetical protein